MHDPFGCSCRKCSRNWTQLHPSLVNQTNKAADERQADTANMLKAVRQREAHPAVLRIGDRVVIHGNLSGIVKYIGPLDHARVAPPTYVGVHLDDNIRSLHNGLRNGKRYFHCPPGHGAFVRYGQVTKVTPPETRPPLKNAMFPSYEHIYKLRRERRRSLSSESSRSRQTSDGSTTAVPTSLNPWQHGINNQIALDNACRRIHARYDGGPRASSVVATVRKLYEANQTALSEDLKTERA